MKFAHKYRDAEGEMSPLLQDVGKAAAHADKRILNFKGYI
jgi:hypothetical protein